MKTISVAFWVLAAFIGLGLVGFTYRGLPYIVDYTGILRWMWVSKILSYVGVAIIGYLVYTIKQTLDREGYFNPTSVKRLKTVGYVGLLTAVINAVANACMATWKLLHKDVALTEAGGDFVRYFLEEILDQSLILFIFVLFFFMFYYFTQRAIAVKNENESFI